MTEVDADRHDQEARLDCSEQPPDQIRTIAQTLREHRRPEVFPQAQEPPNSLVFVKGDTHAGTIFDIPLSLSQD